MRKKALLSIALLVGLCVAGACKRTITFGVVADIQYHPGKPLGTRYYSASVDKLREALARFSRDKVQFVFNLGDTIDHNIQSFDGVMPLFRAFRAPVYHLLGNHDHDVQAGDESGILPALGLKASYYAFTKGSWRFIILDGFELRYPFPADETLRREAEALYERLRAQGKENAQRWNGGIGSAQTAWLEKELEAAGKGRQYALVLNHFPVLPESVTNLWNDTAVVEVLERHACVKAYFAGHNHGGDYALRNGIHYLTYQGMVETPDRNSFAVVTLEKDNIRVRGFGREPSRVLPILARETPLNRHP
jgi:manganese-dependent ADP-ribose/CDP-alcohol diphosphatase